MENPDSVTEPNTPIPEQTEKPKKIKNKKKNKNKEPENDQKDEAEENKDTPIASTELEQDAKPKEDSKSFANQEAQTSVETQNQQTQAMDTIKDQEIEAQKLKIECLEQNLINDTKFYQQKIQDAEINLDNQKELTKKQIEAQKAQSQIEMKNMNDLHQEMQDRMTQKQQNTLKKQTESLHGSYAQKMSMLQNQNDQALQKVQKDFNRDLIENCVNLLQDLDSLSPDEEDMFDNLRGDPKVTQDMIIELTYKILQPRIEYIRLDQEELKEDKMELQDHVNDLKTKIKQNLEEYNNKNKDKQDEYNQHIRKMKLEIKELEQDTQQKLMKLEQNGKMPETQMMIFKQTWTGICERFDQAQMEKYRDQAKNDSEIWINKRLLKSMEGVEIDKNFLSLFQFQLQILYQLFFHGRAQTQQITEREKKVQQLEAQSAKLNMDLKEQQLALKQSLQKLDDRTEQEGQFQNQMDKLIQEKIMFKMNSDEKRERVEILSEENKSLRMKVMDLDDDNKRYKKMLKQLQITIDNQESLQIKCTQLQNELQFANTKLALTNRDHEESKRSIGNLQRAMSSQGEEHARERRSKEVECRKLRILLEELQLKVASQAKQVEQLNEYEKQIQIKDEQIQEITGKIEKYQYENEEIKNQTLQLIEQVKKEEQDKEFMVDRRMINQFLITYVNKNSDHKTRINMLQAMSKILQFTEAEKQTLGLFDNEEQAAAKRGFSQSLVSFLMNDDE